MVLLLVMGISNALLVAIAIPLSFLASMIIPILITVNQQVIQKNRKV